MAPNSCSRRLGILSFFVIAPMIELLTSNVQLGAAPPPMILMLTASYGAGALLARELVVRWRGGLASILVLGLVYGIINEALTSGGFFDPRYYSVVDLGLEGFGRWGGVNVVWALGLMGVHAFWSVSVPISVIEALFPGWVGLPLLGKRGLVISVVVLAASIAMGRVIGSMTGQAPIARPALVAVIVITTVLIGAARTLAHARRAAPQDGPWRLAALAILGLLATLGWFASTKVVRHLTQSPVAVCIALFGLMSLYCWRLYRGRELSLRGRLALVTGSEALLIFSALRSGVLGPSAFMIAVVALAWIRVSSAGAARSLRPI